MKKGVIGNSIVISTKLTNGFFTSFFDQMSPQAVLLFTQSPGLIPVVNCGDVLTLAGGKSAKDRKDAKGAKGGKGNKPPTSGGGMGNVAVVYRALKAEWPPQSVVVLAVVSVDASGGTVEGFVTVQVDKIRASGNPKYLSGTILSLDLPAAQ